MDLRDIKSKVQKVKCTNETMCYNTSDKFLRETKKNTDISKTKIKSIPKFKVFMKNINTLPSVLNMEIMIKTKREFTTQERNSLVSKYHLNTAGYDRFVMRKPKLRLMLHAFNIIKINDGRILLAQSWANIHGYRIQFVFTKATYLLFLNDLCNAVQIFNKDPETFYRIFGQNTHNDAKVVNMIKGEHFGIKTSFRIYY